MLVRRSSELVSSLSSRNLDTITSGLTTVLIDADFSATEHNKGPDELFQWIKNVRFQIDYSKILRT